MTRSMEIFYFRWQITLHLPRGGRERISFFRIRLYRILRFYLEKEYAVALESRSIIEEMTGYRISDDEAGFIALHIHSGLSDEAVSETLKATQLIDESMQIIEEQFGKEMQKEALNYIQADESSVLYGVRTKTGEAVNIDLNEFVQEKYPEAMKLPL